MVLLITPISGLVGALLVQVVVESYSRYLPHPKNLREMSPFRRTHVSNGLAQPSRLVDGFKCVLFSPLFGEDVQFDYYFSIGSKPPTRSRSRWMMLAD